MAQKSMFRKPDSKSAPAKSSCCSGPSLPAGLTQQKLDEMIKTRAYYIWERNGKKGDSTSNWLKAKEEMFRELKIK